MAIARSITWYTIRHCDIEQNHPSWANSVRVCNVPLKLMSRGPTSAVVAASPHAQWWHNLARQYGCDPLFTFNTRWMRHLMQNPSCVSHAIDCQFTAPRQNWLYFPPHVGRTQFGILRIIYGSFSARLGGVKALGAGEVLNWTLSNSTMIVPCSLMAVRRMGQTISPNMR